MDPKVIVILGMGAFMLFLFIIIGVIYWVNSEDDSNDDSSSDDIKSEDDSNEIIPKDNSR